MSVAEVHNERINSDANKIGNWKDMANISLKDCSDTEDGQKWMVMADGRIAVALSSPRKYREFCGIDQN